ncbi:MAG: molybdopterin-synthase adenylyltransferase MoeB [Rhodospirillales bacterium]|nr:molybdopterin-synthase adenylyltransferase MoeB [Rhodospirillales bacterium]
MDFSEQQIERYARHILLGQVGGKGQEKLLASKVLVIGAGGLGSPVLLYLAAAGVGTLGIIDDDVVDLSNLQRQVIHATASIGMAKVDSAKNTIAAINPDVRVITYQDRITAGNAMDLIGGYDLVADGSDNFATRFLVNDACYLSKTPLVSAAILQFDGQVATYKAHEAGDNPCYRCLFPEPPPPGQVPSCAEAGVLGAMCGMIGSLQATEALKELMGIGQSLSGSLLICEALGTEFRKIKVRRDPGCALCGETPTITDLSLHEIAAGEQCRPAASGSA